MFNFYLGILAGVFIEFAAERSNVSAYGLGKAMAGVIFETGLMMVLIAGAVFVGAVYWFIYVRKNSQTQKSSI